MAEGRRLTKRVEGCVRASTSCHGVSAACVTAMRITVRAPGMRRDRFGSLSMHIWVDADACPKVIKDLLVRTAERRQIALTLVANQPLRTPPSPSIRTFQVPAGFDAADHAIMQRVQAGDLVVTADLPLAARVVAQGARAEPQGPL